jgi:hypothetical protein
MYSSTEPKWKGATCSVHRDLSDYAVDGYAAAIGRRLPTHQVEHKPL